MLQLLNWKKEKERTIKWIAPTEEEQVEVKVATQQHSTEIRASKWFNIRNKTYDKCIAFKMLILSFWDDDDLNIWRSFNQ